jgi:hypothetical protein
VRQPTYKAQKSIFWLLLLFTVEEILAFFVPFLSQKTLGSSSLIAPKNLLRKKLIKPIRKNKGLPPPKRGRTKIATLNYSGMNLQIGGPKGNKDGPMKQKVKWNGRAKCEKQDHIAKLN